MKRQYSESVGDPSSKYGYGRCLDTDINDKLKVAKELEDELKEAIGKERRYKDNIPMSQSWKREILIKVFKAFIGGERDK